MQRHKKKIQWALLLWVVLALVVYAFYSQLISVPPFYDRYDPEMAYFIGSLGVFDGHGYQFADHPGTPLNVFGTLIFAILRLVTPLPESSNFTETMFLHPEQFLLVARLFITLLNIVAITYIWHFIKDRVSLAGLTFILTSYFVVLGAGVWYTSVVWSHNSVCLSLGTLFLFVTYQVLSSEKPRTYIRLAWLGAGAGFLLSIQLYFLAWVIGLLAVVFFLLLLEKQSWSVFVKSGGAVTGGIIAGFVITNLPVLHRFPYMFEWFGDVIGHLGMYGQGEPGTLSIAALWENFVIYLQNGFVLLFATLAIVIVGLVVLAVRRRKFAAQKVLWASAAGVSSQALVVCLLVFKHPNTVYLVAVSAMLPMLFFIWFSLYQPRNKWWRAFYPVVAGALLFLMTISWVYAFQNNDMRKNVYETRSSIVEDYLTAYAAQHDVARDQLRIYTGYSAAFNRCEPLWFGNMWAGNIYDDEITALCPNENQWDAWQGKYWQDFTFTVEQQRIPFADYDDWDIIIVSNIDPGAVEFFEDKAVTVEWLGYGLSSITH